MYSMFTKEYHNFENPLQNRSMFQRSYDKGVHLFSTKTVPPPRNNLYVCRYSNKEYPQRQIDHQGARDINTGLDMIASDIFSMGVCTGRCSLFTASADYHWKT